MKAKQVGSLYVLNILPIWATMWILFVVAIGVIIVGRKILEGVGYNIAYSSAIGDVGLMCGVLIGASILQRGGCYVPKLLQSRLAHTVILAIWIIFSIGFCMITLAGRNGRAMDIYHDLVVMPMFLYLGTTVLPIIVLNGTRIEKTATICFLVLWVGLLGLETKYQPNQRAELKRAVTKWRD